MNEINCKIIGVESLDSIALVEMKSGNQILKSIIIESPDSNNNFKIGEKVKAIFKETEVIIGIGEFENISLQNRMPCKIYKIEEGKLLSKIYLNSEIGDICSIITTKSVGRLNLKLNLHVMAMIKTNEIMLSKC